MNPTKKKYLVTLGVLLAVIMNNLVFMRLTRKQQPIEARTETGSAAATVSSTDQAAEAAESTRQSKGMAAVELAARTKKYSLILFYKNGDEQTRTMQQVITKTMNKLAAKAMSFSIDVDDPEESDIVNKFGVLAAPMPLALVVAPNGAVTGGFPATVEEKQLTEAFVSPGMAECLKPLQEGKLVFLCVQNRNTKFNSDAMRGVRDFKSDARFASYTEIVMLNPSDKAESKLLNQLQIEPTAKEAITVFFAPPGTAIARISGATDKASLLATLQNASSSCGPSGCAPSGCGPAQ